MLDDYGAHLVSLSRIGDDGEWPSDTGAIHGVVVNLNSKSLVWTNEPEFTDLGYEAPSDWASFMSLANEMVADGQTPFCLGIESGDADGWPATDWVETIVLRTAGPDFYDQWINHEVPFDDPIVVDAIRTVGEMVHHAGVPRHESCRGRRSTVRSFALQRLRRQAGVVPDDTVPQLHAASCSGTRSISPSEPSRSRRSGSAMTMPSWAAAASRSRSQTVQRSAR